tara:strand:- start:6236 stop:7366 length:1131 start_codon:yes stop_codon:yes gene_type:complete
MPRDILIVSNTSWYLYNFRLGLINALIQRKNRVFVLAPKDSFSIRLKDSGCFYYHLDMDNKGVNPITDILMKRRLRNIYSDIFPELIIHYTIKPVIYGSMAAAQLGIPFVNNITGLGTAFINKRWFTTLVKSLYRKSQQEASLVLFQNGEDKQLFVEKKLVPQFVPRKVIPGTGVNIEQFSFRPYHLADPWTFLLIARLIWDKGVGEFVEAAKKIKKEFPKTRFQILGYLDVKNRTAISRMQMNRWVEEGIIEYLGDTEDVREHIERAGCVVLPSYREGLPKTLLEAAAMRRPIIATDVTGCREIVQEGKNGFLCRVKDPENLGTKMKQFLQLPLKEKEKMGLEGRRLVENRFDETNVVASIVREIEKLLSTAARE